jgi:hypothetical protein
VWKLESWEKKLPAEFDLTTRHGRAVYERFFKNMVILWCLRLGLDNFHINVEFPLVKPGAEAWGHTDVSESMYFKAEIEEEIDPTCTRSLRDVRQHVIHEVCHILLGVMATTYADTIQKNLPPLPEGREVILAPAFNYPEEQVCVLLARAFYKGAYG